MQRALLLVPLQFEQDRVVLDRVVLDRVVLGRANALAQAVQINFEPLSRILS